MTEIHSPVGELIEPTFPEEAPPEAVAEPVFEVWFTYNTTRSFREALGVEQRDATVGQLTQMGAVDIEVT